MDAQLLHQKIRQVYQEINDRWLRFHTQLLALFAVASSIVELLMFFIIYKSNMMTYTIAQYWYKYIIVPICLVSIVTAIAFFIVKNNRFSIGFKQYGVSFSFLFISFVLSFMHSGFVAVLVCSIIPVIMTVIYENQKLTILTAILSICSQAISGRTLFWDPDKVINSTYIINIFILIIASSCVLLTCIYMIKFMKLKRDIVISNDIERYHLQKKVNIDGLTQIGNKLALINRLESIGADGCDLRYLAMLDIDDFKKINDNYGHIFGDDVLRCVGDGMKNIKVSADAFRYGGDEFCILFSEPSLEAVISEIKAVQLHLKLTLKMPNSGGDIFISVGVTPYSADKTYKTILEQADAAMYESKKNKDGRIIIFNNDIL